MSSLNQVERDGAAKRPGLRIAMIGVKGVPHPGGIENVVEELGSRLAARGHEITVYVRPHYTSPSMREFHGMRLFHLPSIPTKHFDAVTHTFLATAHAMISRTNVAHVHSIGLSPFVLPLRLNGIKTVVQSHGLDWRRNKWGPIVKAYLLASNHAAIRFPHATTVVSRTMQRYYEDRFGQEVVYIPNGVSPCQRVAPDLILQLGLQPNGYILFASRLVPEKGLHYLLNAYRSISNPNKMLVVAGDSNYGDEYAARMKALGCGNIIFLGFVRGRLFEELLSWAYLYVLPSEIEGLSTGLLQAMSYGNCVLVSNIPENREVTEEAGRFFESKSVPDLKEQLEALINNEDLIKEYRCRATERVRENYSWDNVADEYEKLYCQLM
jgi:glycosyltransferase involved in cell wall biosynthesis